MKTPRYLFSSLMAAVLLTSLAGPASAGTLMNFGQISSSNTVSATNPTASTTEIQGVNILIDVTQAQFSSIPAPFEGYLNFTVNSSAAAGTLPGIFAQQYTGTFTITSGLNGTGTNYLSDTTPFTWDLVGATQNATTLSLFSNNPGNFTSSIMSLVPGSTGVSFSFSNVTGLPSTGGNTSSLNANNTMNAFGSSVSGSFTGSAVPEPSSLALLGFGAVGCVIRGFRRQRTTKA